MTAPAATPALDLSAEVLIIGGGPAGAWAAWSAASAGANVVLAEKGYVGTSGATAAGGTNLLYVPPDPEQRDAAVAQRMKGGGLLSEPDWIRRVLETVYSSLGEVETWGYPFVRDGSGTAMRGHLQGLEYMRLMRRKARTAGVRILDQSPALELLIDDHGIAGARGINRVDGRGWKVRAGAVVIATGGCAFLSKGLGCNVLTGEGLQMAAEAGAEMSGMEFSRAYAPSAAFGTVTRGRMLGWATISDRDGNVLFRGGGRSNDELASALLKGPVHAVLDRADTPRKREILRHAHSVFFLPYDRAGIDPFTQPFPLTLRFEGTVRGTGGIRIAGENCETTVPGLFAAGDAASRERVHGGQSGGGAFNASWAICSGRWSGRAAAEFAREAAPPQERTPSSARERSAETEADGAISIDELISSVQREVRPLEIGYFRSEAALSESLKRLNALPPRPAAATSPTDVVRAREAESMRTIARWMHTAAITRKESRAMHTLAEYPETDPGQRHRLKLTGIERISITPEAVPA